MSGKLTHFDEAGAAHMVDVSAKSQTTRTARAECRVHMAPETFAMIAQGEAKKGDVLGVARLAGIMAAKKTHDLIPLCHPLALSKVSLEFETDADASTIRVEATVRTIGQTGVEMEALTAATIAALTIYDMVKAVDRGMTITDTRLVMKEGGKSGLYQANT